MQQQKKYSAKEIARDSLWVTIAWEWLQKLLGRAVDAVLWVTMVFAGYQLIPGAPQPWTSVSIFMFVAQFVALDIGGLGLNQLARQQGLSKWSYARVVAYILIGITLVTIAYAGLEHAVKDLDPQVTVVVEVILVVARSVMTVLYGQAIHTLKAEEHIEQDHVAELETQLNARTDELNALTINLNAQLNAKANEVHAVTINLNGQLNALQQRLNAKDQEVNALRIKVNAQTEEIHTLGVKLEHKDAQLNSIRDAHNSSQEAIQEATLSVKSSLTNAHKEVESLRSKLLSAQGSLQAEKQKALTLMAENEHLNGQLNAKSEDLNGQLNALMAENERLNTELHAVTINLNGQLNALQQRLNAKDQEVNAQLNASANEPNADKIVQLDTQTSLNYEVRIRELLESEPGLSGGEISRRLGCSIPTACHWKKRIEKERKEA